jgi:hypothetical protein
MREEEEEEEEEVRAETPRCSEAARPTNFFPFSAFSASLREPISLGNAGMSLREFPMTVRASTALLLATAIGLAGCAGPEKAPPSGASRAGFRTLIAGEPAALDRLEKAARGCRLQGIRRDRSPEQRLSFDTPAGEPRPGDPFACFIDWTKAHPETSYVFVGNAPAR